MTDDDLGAEDERVTELNGAHLGGDAPPEEDLEWPIGFLIVLGLAALYLGWRLIQLVGGAIDLLG